VRQLEKEGLTTVKEIRVEESQPFIFILKPQSKEITDEGVVNATELALRTVSVFDSGGGLKHDDIDVTFRRPMEQQVLLIKRRNMLELLSADIYGEVTIPLIKPISGALSIGLTREKWKLGICECMVCYPSNLSCLRRKFSG
jgi:hypothetical protein